jgi:hypothetical protein
MNVERHAENVPTDASVAHEDPNRAVSAFAPLATEGPRSGAAARKDAELVPLWVGKYDPALIALADVGVSST